jgi:hypothetical protein
MKDEAAHGYPAAIKPAPVANWLRSASTIARP